jgi:hypothetical protein
MLYISDFLIMITSTTTTTSPIIIPISSAVHVLGRNYDESILLTSKYNQVIFLVLYYFFHLVENKEQKGKKRNEMNR